jgi:hypothetical protein
MIEIQRLESVKIRVEVLPKFVGRCRHSSKAESAVIPRQTV